MGGLTNRQRDAMQNRLVVPGADDKETGDQCEVPRQLSLGQHNQRLVVQSKDNGLVRVREGPKTSLSTTSTCTLYFSLTSP